VTPTPPDPWAPLTRLTPARIALGRAGGSLPTSAHLDFQLAHARARDAVQHPADFDFIEGCLRAAGLRVIRVASAVPDRATYLRRPDLGRRLAVPDRERVPGSAPRGDVDVALVVADGLSGFAVERHAPPLVTELARRLSGMNLTLAPLTLVQGGRVAIGDEIGQLLGAEIVVVLIGERPGLSSPDSLGAYLTYAPRPGRMDAERNCVSNIRPEGLPVESAAERICWLVAEARRRKLTGVELKEEARRLGGGTANGG
jgi:ethanolamine ammonia-lyase small subunit